MKTSGGAPNVWPGYVAAVAGLGISLLLLIAVLGLGIFQIGANIHEKIVQGFKVNIEGDKKLITSSGEKDSVNLSEKIKISLRKDKTNRDLTLNLKSSEVAKILSITKGDISLPKMNSDKLFTAIHNNDFQVTATADKMQEGFQDNYNGSDADILFHFSNGVYKLNEQAKKTSQDIIERHSTGYKVIVWASASVDIESASRIAYIRILAVRNYLLDSGFSRENVIIKLVPVSFDGSKQNEVKVKFSIVDASVAH